MVVVVVVVVTTDNEWYHRLTRLSPTSTNHHLRVLLVLGRSKARISAVCRYAMVLPSVPHAVVGGSCFEM